MEIPQLIRELIATGPHAHLTTLNPDGSPQVSAVWVGIDGDDLVFGHMAEHQKVRNVRRAPRVALSLPAPGTNAAGLQNYLVVYGRGTVVDGGAPELLQRLANVYLGPDVSFPPESIRDRPGYILRLRPERFAGSGPWNP